MKQLFKWVIARGREPSTYAGLASILVALHISDATSWANNGTTLAIGFFGVVAMFAKETGALD